MIIPNLVCVLFDPVIPTSSFNLFNYFLYLFYSFFYCPLGNSCLSTLELPGTVCPFNAGLYHQWVKLHPCFHILYLIFCKCVTSSVLTFDFRVQDHWMTECMVTKKLVYTCLTRRSDTSRHQASICARWTVDTCVEETCICLLLNIIESVDSISRDGPDMPYM